MITQLSIETTKELIAMGTRWVNDCEALTKLCQAEYLEEPTQEDKDYQVYDEGEPQFISMITGLKMSLNSQPVLNWIKKCQDNHLEFTKKFETSKLELDGLKASLWKRKKNQAEVQYAKTELLYETLVKQKPDNYATQFGSSADNKKVMTESAHKDMMKYLTS
tara:strand:- start:255 stop:743 length:489 start_codon:yes stop_codon:yes gene_type:complete